jgi:septal ring factor EnvC (AmiA/AmiB activator)
MRKTIALLAVGALGLIVLAKATHVGSYVGTFCAKAKASIKDSVPTEFDIDRIDREIANLDQKLDQMIRPIAAHKVEVDRLRKDVAERETKLKEQKEVLLAATAAVKNAKPGEKLVYGQKAYRAEQVKARIALDFESYKRQEANLAAQRKLLELRETTLQAAQDQLQGFMAKKEEFRVQLAQLRAEHEINKVNALGANVEMDNTPLATIAESLGDLKDKIERQRLELELRNQVGAVAGIQLSQPQQNAAAVDLDAIQAHLERGAANGKTTTASNR